jgi:triacylglycerol lipase
MSSLSAHLSDAGHSCFSPTLTPADARSGLSSLSEQLQRYIRTSLPSADRFALVGYSMGALVCRHYLQELDGRCRVEAFFSIAGPHCGTVAAFLYPGRGAREMRPRSAFIRRLDETSERLSGLPITCYWSPMDPLIVPTRSARMKGTECIRVPLSFHPLLTFDRRIQRDIERRLSVQTPNQPPEPTRLSGVERSYGPSPLTPTFSVEECRLHARRRAAHL